MVRRGGWVAACLAVIGCNGEEAPGTGGAGSTSTSETASSSDAVSSSSGGPASCEHLVVDPVLVRPEGHRQFRFVPWPGSPNDVAFFAVEAEASPNPQLPGEVWATQMYDAFGAAWPPNTLHKLRVPTNDDVFTYLLDDVAQAPNLLTGDAIFRDVLAAGETLHGVASARAFARAGDRFVVASTESNDIHVDSYGTSHVVETPPAPCFGSTRPLSVARLPRLGSAVVVSRAPDADDPTCAKSVSHLLAIDRYDAPGTSDAPMVHTEVARVVVDGVLFDLTTAAAPTGAWVLMRVDQPGVTTFAALQLDGEGSPIGEPHVVDPNWGSAAAITSAGDGAAVVVARDDPALVGGGILTLSLVRADGAVGPSVSVAVPGSYIDDVSVMADPLGRGFLMGSTPGFGEAASVVRVRCE